MFRRGPQCAPVSLALWANTAKALAVTAFRSHHKGFLRVGATGIEPVTSAVSSHIRGFRDLGK